MSSCLAANPLARMKMARERRTRRQVLSVAEEQLLLGAAKDHLHAMIIFALDTGMRRGEITGQRWEDIDFSRKLLVVTRSKTPEGESREIPLTGRLHELVLRLRKSEGLVIDFRGRPVRIVKRSWKTALKNAGSAPHSLSRSSPQLQYPLNGSRRPARSPHGAHGPLHRRKSSLDLHPH